MDMNLFRKSLASRQNILTEIRADARALADRLVEIPRIHHDKNKRIAAINDLVADVERLSISPTDKNKIQSNLSELSDAIQNNEYSDAEILVNTIRSQLAKA